MALAFGILLAVLTACSSPALVTATPTASQKISDPQIAAARRLETDSETPPGLYFQNDFRFVSGGFANQRGLK